jgi:hypothetical protein
MLNNRYEQQNAIKYTFRNLVKSAFDLKYILLDIYHIIHSSNNPKKNDRVINFIRNNSSFSYKEVRLGLLKLVV